VAAAHADIDLIREVDVAWGKARWAARFRARRPQLSDDPTITLKVARHPLLLEQFLSQEKDPAQAFRKVMPIDLELSNACRAVIISGPNTGGKTVALKTTGLAVAMTQAGLPIPADPESTVGAFDAVFADIGDEQSLALSLSTFSAHLKQVGESCRRATERSLVLLDELGVGTDPEEGAALASAVILALVERGTKVLITTHYSMLKTLSEKDGHIRNAAFLFDEKHLAPTYQLAVGQPGASYALEIARRLGFPEQIVSRAQAGVGKQAGELARLLSRLAEEELASRQAKIELDLQTSRLAALVEYNRTAQEKWERLEKTAARDARRQAEAIVSEARRETEQIIARIRRGQAQPDDIKAAHETFARLLERAGQESDPGASLPGEPGEFSVGQRVRVAGLSQIAEVTQVLQEGKRIQVQIGQVHYTVDREALTPADPASDGPPQARSAALQVTATPEDAPFEVDLRGKAVDESILELEEIIEASDRQGYRQLRVIHGRGTGVLRRELTRWFKQHPRVRSSRLGGRGEGGDGVTIVELSAP
jgi:DNA mismatch repair protein MutS2